MPETTSSLRSAYISHPRIRTSVGGSSLAKQSFKNECDVNHIMKKYAKTGLLDHVATHKGDYSNLLNEMDFHDAQNAIIAAENSFNSLPSAIRTRFHNEPGEFLAFVDDPENGDELITMGLREPIPDALLNNPIPTPEAPEPPSDTLPVVSN